MCSHIPHNIKQVQKNHNTSVTSSSHAGNPLFSKWPITHYQPPLLVILSMNKVDQIIITAVSVQFFHCNIQKFSIRLWSSLQPECLFGVFSVCSWKFISSYHHWSARRQGPRSWQPSLSDLGVDQQPVWAQEPGWIYIRTVAAADPPLRVPLSQTALSYQELNFGGSQGMRHSPFS